MKSESVTKAWEFYRDNCPGFKEPMRKEFRRLDEYVASLESENAKLRELVRDMWPHVRHRSRMCQECELPCNESDECLLYEPMRYRMRELGIEVDG